MVVGFFALLAVVVALDLAGCFVCLNFLAGALVGAASLSSEAESSWMGPTSVSCLRLEEAGGWSQACSVPGRVAVAMLLSVLEKW